MQIAEPDGPVFYVSFKRPYMPKKEQFEAAVLVCTCCMKHAEKIACDMVDADDVEITIVDATDSPYSHMSDYFDRVLDLSDIKLMTAVAMQ